MAEIRAEERMRGFHECLDIVRREWRATATMVPESQMTPVQRARWDILRKCDAHAGLLDDDLKELMMPRCYPGTNWTRLRVRVEVVEPHPHAGRRGFILDSEAFREHGGHIVYFTDGKPGVADNALAKEEHIKRVLL